MPALQWPHAPVHWTFESGTYMLTAGTHHKQPLLAVPEARDQVCATLFALAAEYGFSLQAWAVLSNHYHLIFSTSLPEPPIAAFVRRFHGVTAHDLNARDAVTGRKVWFQYWDSRITYEASLLARLRYVHTNPAHHNVVADPETYRWCSAAWFARSAPKSFVETVSRFKTDRVSVPDDF